jgi:cytochrome c peroxidase
MKYLSLWFFLTSGLILAAVEPRLDTRLGALPLKAPQPQGIKDDAKKVSLGRLLFFDPILSATRSVACATCHHPQHGWADGRVTPLGVYAQGLGPERRRSKPADIAPIRRNSPTILNVAFNGIQPGQALDPRQSPMFWDNRERGLEAQVLHPIRNREEMRGDACTEPEAVPAMLQRLRQIPGYRQRFKDAFGMEIDITSVTRAIAAYERSLITTDTAFDRFMRGDNNALTAEQKQGLEVFHRAGCSLCHNGPMLSDYKLHAIGLNDAESRSEAFRTPSLRQLRHTAPYMHHGEMNTLDEVLLFYDRLMDQAAETLDGGDQSTLPPLDPLFRQMNLLPEYHAPLRAFLESLSTDSYDQTLPASVPSGLAVPGLR